MNECLIGFEEHVKHLGVFHDRQVPFVVFRVKRILESGLPDAVSLLLRRCS